MIHRSFKLALIMLLACRATAQSPLSLDEAIKLALQNNFDIEVARNEAEIASLQNNWGNAGRLPTVTAQSGFTFSSTDLEQRLNTGVVIKRNGATNRLLNANVTGSWRIFNGNRAIAAKKRLEEQERIGGLSLKQQTDQVVYDVMFGYYNIARLQQQLEALKQTTSLFEERLKLSKARFEVGTAAKNDQLQSQVDLNQQRNAVLEIENNILKAKTNLNNLLSRDPSTAFSIADSVGAVALPPKQQVIGSIDTLNPFLLIAKSNEVVLIQQHTEINAQRLPTLTLNAGGNLNLSNNSAGLTLYNRTLGPQANVTLAIPIFQGGVIKQQLRVNEISQQNQRIRANGLKNDLLTTITNAYNDLDNAKRQYENEKLNLALIQENTNISMERFRRAAITTVELRQVQLNLIETQTNLINARYNMKLAEMTVQWITGSLVN